MQDKYIYSSNLDSCNLGKWNRNIQKVRKYTKKNTLIIFMRWKEKITEEITAKFQIPMKKFRLVANYYKNEMLVRLYRNSRCKHVNSQMQNFIFLAITKEGEVRMTWKEIFVILF
jgi:hypothetical protein